MPELEDIATKRIVVNYSRLNLRKHFFINRVVQLWNKLPEEVVQVPTLSMFKAHLLTATGLKLDMDIVKGLWPNIYYIVPVHNLIIIITMATYSSQLTNYLCIATC